MAASSALDDTYASRSATGSPTGDEMDADLRYLTFDPKDVSKIMRKRQEEMARRTKLVNTKAFRHGVPPHHLDKQVAEKQAAAAAIKAEDEYHDRYRVVSDQVAQVCETIRHDATRERHKACTDYSLENLRKEQRREYDLSDPNLIKSERPTRDGDNDPRLGASSIQQFEGEDFVAQQRKKEQVSTMREWLHYQMAQKKEYVEREGVQTRLYDEAMMTANELRGLCEQANIEERQQDKREEAAENKALAVMHHARKEGARARDIKAVQAHVDNEMNSERMMELADYKIGSDGKLMKAEYKRATVEEEQGVYDGNARLILEKQAKSRMERSEDTIAAGQNFSADIVLNTIENEKARATRDRRLAVEEFNKSLIQEKRDFRNMEKQAYRSYEHVEPYTSTANLF